MMGAAVALLAVLLAAVPGGDGGRFLPVSEVRPGMTGIGYTVVQGTAVDTFSVTVLGVLPASRPGGDLILARLAGLDLEHTGIVAGMSGSPVFVDGRLLGAVASGWSFAKDPIAGITPIGEMLSVGDRPGGGGGGEPRAAGLDPATWEALLHARGEEALDLLFPEPKAATGTGGPLPLPVAVAGLADDEGWLDRFLRGHALFPVQGAVGGGDAEASAAPLVPGSAVAIEVVRGDARMAAVGTVTWVDGDRVYALGHPFLGLGGVRFPMSTARILTILPSAISSFKLGVAEAPVGAVTRDYRAAVMGRLGDTVDLVPMTVHLDLPGVAETLSYEMVEAPTLTPSLVAILSLNSMQSFTATTSPSTLRLALRVTLADGRTVHHETLVAGFNPPMDLAGEVARVIGVLLGNPLEEVSLDEVDLSVSLAGGIQAAFLDRVEVPPGPHRPGDTLPVTVRYRDYRGEAWTTRESLALPRDLAAGEYEVSVCDGGGEARAEQERAPGTYQPRDLDRLLRQLEEEPPRDALVLRLLGPGANPVVGDRELSGLPAPWQAVLGTPLTSGRASVAGTTLLARSERRLDKMLFGCGSVSVTVETP